MNSPRRSKDQWRTIIAEFEGGKLNQQDFAQARGVKLGTFCSRLYEFRKGVKSPRFVEVERPMGNSLIDRLPHNTPDLMQAQADVDVNAAARQLGRAKE